MGNNMISLGGLLITLLVASYGATAAENFKLHGALVTEPCSLEAGDENIELDFGSVVDKYLYQHQRTNSKSFTLRLMDCDISLGNTVQISFSGAENPALPGLLALAGGSGAQGVAIGFETASGHALPLDAWSAQEALSDGDNMMALKAYIQAEPNAIANKNIQLGEFHAVATFSLRYE
ncbi:MULTISPECIES: fimbrial protein [Serratia]|jgi:P pilus assembly protein, pilin FimA|uniref:fimbrial protein n=1 Tax=Serratia TaxID=613 RepID=UPI0018A7E1DF|nr:fimbrial protein [Serratia marcescens]MBF8219171.1 type 1 fimbrial protein [Serratia ureilytica]MBF8244680.1 type 1 fimbrial protein [Serratia ureilytica]MBH1916844.1 type 1 fimbrial protein [Serratia marcescens]MBH2678187.1 type 1 fimbrial protein [Serratia marcescens]MBN3974993.1 type 1 fimbrial protein [Serratia marcescens]